MDAIGLLTIVAVVAVTIGDPVFVHIVRIRVPSAFLAAGSPSPVWIAVLMPFYFGPYRGFVLNREFRAHLVRGSRLYLMATILYLAHLIVISLGIFWVGLLVWWYFR
jgi:hypothetical protein